MPSRLLGLARTGISSIQLGAVEHQRPQGSSALPGPVFCQFSRVRSSTNAFEAPRPCPGRYFVDPAGCGRAPAAGALRPCPGRYFVNPAGCGRAPMPLRLLVECWCTVQSNQCPRAEPTSTVWWWWINFLFLLPWPPVPRSSQSDII